MEHKVELQHLRYVIAVAEHGSFRRAAGTMGIRVSTISRCIRYLEDEIGVALFDRRPNGVKLTFAGEHFLVRARRAVMEVNKAIREAGTAGTGQIGFVRIGLAHPVHDAENALRTGVALLGQGSENSDRRLIIALAMERDGVLQCRSHGFVIIVRQHQHPHTSETMPFGLDFRLNVGVGHMLKFFEDADDLLLGKARFSHGETPSSRFGPGILYL